MRHGGGQCDAVMNRVETKLLPNSTQKGEEIMKVTSVTVQMGRTITKNYNSFQNSVGVTATLSDDENHEQVTRQLQKECYRLMLKESPFQKTELVVGSQDKKSQGDP
jgi:hypothetical protein